jgi:hypothetical protein
VKKSLRIALTVAVLASLAPIALADPGGTIPQPYAAHHTSMFAAIIAAFLSWIGV